jgi:hypothetical protein
MVKSEAENDMEAKFLRTTLQGENPRSGLNLLCLAMALLKALFYVQGFSPG